MKCYKKEGIFSEKIIIKVVLNTYSTMIEFNSVTPLFMFSLLSDLLAISPTNFDGCSPIISSIDSFDSMHCTTLRSCFFEVKSRLELLVDIFAKIPCLHHFLSKSERKKIIVA